MNYIQVEGMEFNPISNYNGYLKSNTNFDINKNFEFQNVLNQKQALLETPSKIEGGIQMVDFDKIIAESQVSQKSSSESGNFLNNLSGSIGKGLGSVNQKMKAAERAQEAFAMGENVSVHDVMIAAEKSSLSFQMAMQLRNKMISAYTELNNIKV